jgi:S1-C subfamily serine protease
MDPVRRFVAALLIAGLASCVCTESLGESVDSAIVHVFVRQRAPDLQKPWRRQDPERGEASGVIIAGERILTAAHVVEDQVSLEVQRAGDPKRYPAQVLQAAPAYDLALLSVEDEAFFEGSRPLRVDSQLLPSGETVQAVGFPNGGENVAVTQGVFSRYDFDELFDRDGVLLGEVDAAVNEGNSGGPVLRHNAIVGIAVATRDEAQGMGYMVAGPAVQQFLDDVSDGHLDGAPELATWWQPVVNEAHRRRAGLAEGQCGILVTGLLPAGTGRSALQKGDVITAIDGVKVDDEGMIALAEGARVSPDYLVARRQVGEEVTLEVLRHGVPQTLGVKAERLEWVIPERSRKYFVFGATVFRPLTLKYLSGFEQSPSNLYSFLWREAALPSEVREIVVIADVLANRVNEGYEDLEDQVVVEVNGHRITGLDDLVEVVSGSTGEWIEMLTDTGGQLVFDRKQALASFAEVSAEYDIPSDRYLGD